MNTLLPLQLFPVRGRGATYCLVALLLVSWICMMFASSNHAAGTADGIRIMLNLSALLIGVIGARQMQALARARVVIGKQQMPEALWRAWTRACVVETSLLWAVLAAAMCLLLASPGSRMPWPAALAVISCALSLAAGAVLAHHAMLPRALGLLAYAIGAALLVAAIWTDAGRIVAWFAQLPLPALELLALSWPLLAGALMIRFSRQLGAFRWSPAAPRRGLRAAVAGQMRRYTPLDMKKSRCSVDGPQNATARARGFWLLNGTFPVYVFFNSFSPLVWDQPSDVRHALSLAMLILFMSQGLIARDLHWRSLLMPAGWQRGRIASGIFVSTMQAQCATIGAATLLFVLIERVVDGMPAAESLRIAANHSLLLFEVALAVAVGLIVRTFARQSVIVIGGFVAIFCCWLFARFGVGYAALPHLPAGGAVYAAVMAAVTGVALLVANRLWTPQMLMECARRRT